MEPLYTKRYATDSSSCDSLYGMGEFRIRCVDAEIAQQKQRTALSSSDSIMVRLLPTSSIMPVSHHHTGQDMTVLSCPCQRYELNWRQVKTD